MEKLKKGTIREDGMVYYRTHSYKDGTKVQQWITPEKFIEKMNWEQKWYSNFRSNNRHKAIQYKADNWQKTLLLQARAHCKMKALKAPEIDEQWILDKFKEQEGKCYWLGIDMIPSITKNSPYKPSLDRLNPKGEYTKDNVVLTCMFANMGRKDTPADEMKKFVDNLRKNL